MNYFSYYLSQFEFCFLTLAPDPDKYIPRLAPVPFLTSFYHYAQALKLAHLIHSLLLLFLVCLCDWLRPQLK